MIGYEFEFLVREGDRPLSKETFFAFHKKLKNKGWQPKLDAGTGNLVGSKKDDIFVGSDDGVNVMEINMPPRDTIQDCDTGIRNLLSELQTIYQSLGTSIIGLNTFPGFYDRNNCICKKFCTDQYCCEKSYIKYYNPVRFPRHHHDLMMIAANHLWLDVRTDQLMDQYNTFLKLSGLFAALFANGPIFNNKKLPILEGRDLFWHNMVSTGIFPEDDKFFGFPPMQYDSILDYFDFMLSIKFYYVEREGKGVSLVDKSLTYKDYFFSKNLDATYFDGTPTTISPTIDDFITIQQVTFPHVRIKYKKKAGVTIDDLLEVYKNRDEQAFLGCFASWHLECRFIGAQPQEDVSAGPALLVGLQENFEETKKLASQHSYEEWKKIYEMSTKDGMQTVFNDQAMIENVKQLVEISKQGLGARGHGEEKFFQPLYDRLEKQKNPAEEILEVWNSYGLERVWKELDFTI